MIFQHLLNESLVKGGEHTAIENGADSITYASLQQRAQAVSAALISNGVGPGSYVGLFLRESVDIIIAMIGVANAGAVFVPLDASLPVQRLRSMTANLPMACILTAENDMPLPGDIPQLRLKALLEEYKDVMPVYPEYHRDDALYIYFTSGSTGIPKGITGKNESLAHFIRWEIQELQLNASCRVSQLISPYFDAFLRDVFVPLFAGGVLCIPPPDPGFFSREIMAPWLKAARITLVHCVPSVFKIIKAGAATPAYYPDLRYVLLSGERIVPAELKPWYALQKDQVQLVNLYGCTETTLIRSYYYIQPEDVNRPRIPVGVPIADTAFLITDDDGKPVKPFVTGDLYIVSGYMSKGYFNDPAKNEEKFITLESGEQAFRTGDKARQLPDGNYELLGRDDRQVKINGIRIEPEEIENVLLSAPSVQQVLVLPVDGKLVAFLTNTYGSAAASKLEVQLKSLLDLSLPEYMKPTEIVFLDVFPVLPNRKTDQQEMIRQYQNRQHKQIIAPKNGMEAALLTVWQELLGKTDISTDDDFNKTGGSSLTLMRLIARIYAQFNVRFPLNDLFQALTIGKQAAYIEKAVMTQQMKIGKAPVADKYPLSAAQLRMYIQYELEPESTVYNIPVFYEINGVVDAGEIEQHIKTLIEKHEILRTSFVTTDGKPWQVIRNEVDFSLAHIRVNEEETWRDSVIRPFDLAAGEICRAAMITKPSGKQFLLFDVHHIACDGLSQYLLFKDFLLLMDGRVLTPLQLQYKDYAVWEEGFRHTAIYEQQGSYWQDVFARQPPSLALPVKVEKDLDQAVMSGGSLFFTVKDAFPAEVIQELKFAGYSEFTVLYTCFVSFLSQLTGQDDLVTGLVTAGREQVELDNMVGMFSKTLPVRCQVNGYHTFRQQLEAINKTLVLAFSNQLYDLSDLQQYRYAAQQHATNRLFDVMFVYQNYYEPSIASQPAIFSYSPHESGTAKYPLSFIASGSEGNYVFRVEYAGNYFSREDAASLFHSFEKVAAALMKSTHQNIIELLDSTNASKEKMDDLLFTF
ncbi:fengycin family lipopeptide synthetase D [Chitinophaga costaii]|uniref:Fengycin family lipopeptide synthetase D n=1 Tax=Chitinophaga costaii TaxID=1335309 RepID=A0A1C3YTR4_9BACT|nr:non-ribosomal peptide synthetase [Chitinophaga costaii]PUZ30104.1 amino acid adenylation domain-containing protein [Chitinophaga costaii]SCB73494.1 fengycin family lipopeptide synthetase D [Chitinophaga costaii]